MMFFPQWSRRFVAVMGALALGLPGVCGAGVAARIDVHPAGKKEIALTPQKEFTVNGYLAHIGWGKPEERQFALTFTVSSISEKWQTAEFAFTPAKSGEVLLFLLSSKTDGDDKWVLFDDLKVEGAELKNPGFEEVAANGKLPAAWEFRSPPAELVGDKTVSASGNNCIKVFHNQPAFQRIKVTAGTVVKISCKVKLPLPVKKKPEPARLEGVFSGHERFSVYPAGETVKVKICGKGEIVAAEKLEYELRDYLERKVTGGVCKIDPAALRQGVELTFPGLPAGCYFLHAKLFPGEVTFAWQGSMPPGYTAFGVLPDIQALPLQYADQSRFGAQGTNFIASGVFMRGDYLSPLYPALGSRWCYRGQKLFELEKEKHSFVPATVEKMSASKPCEAANKIAVITDLHGVPPWLLRCPPYVNTQAPAARNAIFTQSYPVNDLAYYADLVGRVAKQQKTWRELFGSYMRRNYYQIHWEPDWHWNGNDDEFIAMYRAAAQGIAANDPGAFLLGCNYGVIDINNKKLQRLFEKGLNKYINGVVVHLYYLPLNQDPESARLDLACRKLRRMTDKYLGKDAMLMNTEWGIDYRNKYPNLNHDILMTHLARFTRGHLIALGEGFTATWFFYTADYGFKNPGGEDGYGISFNLSDHSFGGTKVAPKPTFMAAATMTRLLEGTKSLGRLDYFGDGVYVYAFRRGEQLVLALWNAKGESKLDLEVAADRVKVYDVVGNGGERPAPQGKLALTLNRFPVYVLGVGTAAVPGATAASSWFAAPLIAATAGQDLRSSLRPGDGIEYRLSNGREEFALTASGGRLPENLGAGDWRLTARRSKGGQLLETALLRVSGAVKIETLGDRCEADGNPVIAVGIKNLSDREQKVEAQVEFGGKLRYTLKSTLKPRASAVETLPVTALQWDHGDPRPLQVTLRNASGIQDRAEIIYGGEKIGTLSPRIDGRLEDWLSAGFGRSFGKEAITYKADLWQGTEDFSCRYQALADAAALYVAVEVKDQAAMAIGDVRMPWRSDSMFIAVGSDPEENCEWGNIRRFGFSIDAAGKPLAQEIFGVPPKGVTTLSDSRLKYAVNRDAARGITVYEVAIPWSEIGNPERILAAGKFGLGISVNDADTEADIVKDRHRVISMRGGIPLFMGGTRLCTGYIMPVKRK